MVLTLNFPAQTIPSRSNFRDRLTYKHHLLYGKTVAAHDVAVRTGGLDVSFDVWLSVVDPV